VNGHHERASDLQSQAAVLTQLLTDAPEVV